MGLSHLLQLPASAQALSNRVPMAVCRDGAGAPKPAVTLRLDNAGALPTTPQPRNHKPW
jgi:hypothetical protein